MQKELTLLERWNAPTSPFFKPLVKPCFILATIAAVIVAVVQNWDTSIMPVPALLNQIATIAGFVLSSVGVIAKLSVDFEKLPEYLAELEKQKALKDL